MKNIVKDYEKYENSYNYEKTLRNNKNKWK